MYNLVATSPSVDSTHLLSLMNVKYVLSIPKINSPNYVWVHASDTIPEDPNERKEYEESESLKIYENKTVMPRSFLVPACKVLNTEKEYRDALQSKDMNPKEMMLLDAEPKNFKCGGKAVSEEQQPVRIDSYKSNALELSVRTEKRQLLFLSETYYPGWKAYINEKPAEILRANYLFRAVVVEPGEHKVRFEYDPLSFKIGLLITFLTFLLCGFYYYKFKIRKHTFQLDHKNPIASTNIMND